MMSYFTYWAKMEGLVKALVSAQSVKEILAVREDLKKLVRNGLKDGD